MAYKSFNKLCRSEFYVIVSAKDRVQDINLYQIHFKVNGTYTKDGMITTNFEPFNGKDVVNKAYLDANLSEANGHIS